jgi:predicted aspartyl protease
MNSNALFRKLVAAYLMLGLGVVSVHAADTCKVNKVDLAVTLSNMRPTISAKINGLDAKLAVVSGAFYSMLGPVTAAKYNLKLRPVSKEMTINAGFGATAMQRTTVNELTLGDLVLPNRELVVGVYMGGSDTDGMLGQEILGAFDVEYDLANGMIRLFQVQGCEHAMLAYWVKPDQAYSIVDLKPPTQSATMASVSINDKNVLAFFNTGAPLSALAMRSAENAGIHPYTIGVQKIKAATYLAPIADFKIGDGEEIKHAKLLVLDQNPGSTPALIVRSPFPVGDMVIGVDFFLSHRIFVANSQRKMYLTYNGGPVFNSDQTPKKSAPTQEQTDAQH